MAEEQKTPEQQDEGGLTVNVDMKTAQALKCQEYDKRIAEAEFAVADLKKQKMSYIFESNVQLLALQAKQQQQGTQLKTPS